MEEGFVLDASYAVVLQPKWMEGPPEKSLLSGVKMRGRAKHSVTTFRCAKCGYLESYAFGDVK
jgi:hypothetical protein